MKKKFLREKLEAERNETMEEIVEKEVEEIKELEIPTVRGIVGDKGIEEPKTKGRKKKND